MPTRARMNPNRIVDYREVVEALTIRLEKAREQLRAGKDYRAMRVLEGAARPISGNPSELEENADLKPEVAHLGAVAATAARFVGGGNTDRALKLLDEQLEEGEGDDVHAA